MSELPHATRRPRDRIGSAAILVVLAGGLYAAARVTINAQDEVYGIPGWGVAVTLGLVALVVVGCALIAWSRNPALGAVSLAAAAFGVLGVLAIFSVGLLALLVSGGLAAWAASREWSATRRWVAAVAGVMAGAPLPLLAILAAEGPVVACGATSTSSGESFFMGLTSGDDDTVTGSGSAGPGGDGGGHVEARGYEYSYECRDGRLVRFDLRWR